MGSCIISVQTKIAAGKSEPTSVSQTPRDNHGKLRACHLSDVCQGLQDKIIGRRTPLLVETASTLLVAVFDLYIA